MQAKHRSAGLNTSILLLVNQWQTFQNSTWRTARPRYRSLCEKCSLMSVISYSSKLRLVPARMNSTFYSHLQLCWLHWHVVNFSSCRVTWDNFSCYEQLFSATNDKFFNVVNMKRKQFWPSWVLTYKYITITILVEICIAWKISKQLQNIHHKSTYSEIGVLRQQSGTTSYNVDFTKLSTSSILQSYST